MVVSLRACLHHREREWWSYCDSATFVCLAMLPVHVKTVSSYSCTLSEASALLQRFLSSDGCSDSFARDYVASVAQALQDSLSRRSGCPKSTGDHSAVLRFPTASESPSRSSKKLVGVKQSIFVAGNTAPSPPHSKLHSHGKKNSLVAKKLVPSSLGDAHTDEKQSFPSAEDGDASREFGSVMHETEHAFKRHKKKRRISAVENGLETDLLCTSEIKNSALMHHDKKRRKKEKPKTETESVIKDLYGPDDQRHPDRKSRKEKQELETKIVETEYPALDKRSSDGKKRRMKEKQGKGTKDMEPLHVPEKSVKPMSGTVEEFAGLWNEGRMFPSDTLSLEKGLEEKDMEASPVEFENPASDKKKKKEKRGRKELGD